MWKLEYVPGLVGGHAGNGLAHVPVPGLRNLGTYIDNVLRRNTMSRMLTHEGSRLSYHISRILRSTPLLDLKQP